MGGKFSVLKTVMKKGVSEKLKKQVK